MSIALKDIYTRYSRQMLLAPFSGLEGQLKLLSARVCVVGSGGLGSTVLSYLAGAGIGFIRIVDHDVVELSNLHRQVMFDTESIGLKKAEAAKNRLQRLNPTIVLEAVCEKLQYQNAMSIIDESINIVIDCTDNEPVRYCMSDACVLRKIPMVSGSAIGFEGQLTLLCHPSPAPCYRCLHPSVSSVEGCRSCASSGVLGPVPGLIGCLQALEAIKYILRDSQSASNTLEVFSCRKLVFDGYSSEFIEFQLPERRADCKVCSVIDDSLLTIDHFMHLYEKLSLSAGSCKPSLQCGQLGLLEYVNRSEFWRKSAVNSAVQTGNSGKPLKTHVVIDVRSINQFRLLSWLHYLRPDFAQNGISAQFKCASRSEIVHQHGNLSCNIELYTILADDELLYLIHLPYTSISALSSNSFTKELLAVVGLSETELSVADCNPLLLNSVYVLYQCFAWIEQHGISDVFTLCRRGNDSTLAGAVMNSYLSEYIAVRNKRSVSGEGALSNMEVISLAGGITKWAVDIDPNFPQY